MTWRRFVFRHTLLVLLGVQNWPESQLSQGKIDFLKEKPSIEFTKKKKLFYYFITSRKQDHNKSALWYEIHNGAITRFFWRNTFNVFSIQFNNAIIFNLFFLYFEFCKVMCARQQDVSYVIHNIREEAKGVVTCVSTINVRARQDMRDRKIVDKICGL